MTHAGIKIKYIVFTTMLLSAYGLLFYFLSTNQLNTDFSSFYASAKAYDEHLNPYQELRTPYLPTQKTAPPNLNPPIFLQITAPLCALDYNTAHIIWSVLLLIFGSIGALLCFAHTLERPLFKKNWPIYLGLYLSIYPTLMNTNFSQIGGFLLFFIMLGYSFFLKKQDGLAGFFWGLISAIKLFPALLLLFALSQHRYKLFWIMLATLATASLIPLLSHNTELYTFYFNRLNSVLWYGNSWNASAYGLLFRLFVDMGSPSNLLLIKTIYLGIVLILLIYYNKQINLLKQEHAFCLTLTMMLFMSPFGWLYYCSLLLMPFILIWCTLNTSKQSSSKNYILWLLCLFCINAPIGNIQAQAMGCVFYKITLYSIYCYGLIGIIYLLIQTAQVMPQQHSKIEAPPIALIVGLSLFTVLSTFICKVL